MRVPTPGALFGLGGLPAQTQRGLAVAFATSIISIMGVQLVFPLLPPLMQQLGIPESAIGLVITAYTVPMIVLAPIAGLVADLHGRRPLLFGGLLLFGLAGAGVGLAPNLEWVLALRALQGVGASAILPLTIVLLSDLVSGHQETSAQGMKVVLDRVGMVVIPLAAGALAALSWRLAFAIFALALPIAFLGLAWLPETRTGARSDLWTYVRGFAAIGGRPRLIIAFSAGFLRFFLDYGYFTYLPIFLAVTRGTSPAAVGALFAAFAVGAMVTASQAGRLVRGHDPARVVFLGFALAGGSVLVIPWLPTTPLVGVSLFVYGLGNGLISPLQKSLLTQNAPSEVRAGVISLDRLVQQVAKSLAPAAMGALLVVADVSAVFWVLGALTLGSLVLAALLLNAAGRPEAYRPADEADQSRAAV
jgi:ACDE family multidrug resistance protein